jgi:putative thioredoxin
MSQGNEGHGAKPTATFGGSFAGSATLTPGAGMAQAATSQADMAVKDISTAQFVGEVIEASHSQPVLIDFWAPWCGPCKQLAPALEKAVAATRGKVKLVKMNIDENPQIPGQMGIQSIPAVVAFVDGRPKDAFMGALPEGEITKFIEKLIGPQAPSPIEVALQEAEARAKQGAASEAANLYAGILQQEPGNAAALAGMGMLYLQANDLERAKAMLDSIAAENIENPKAVSLRAAIELAEQASKLGDISQLQSRIEANENDHQARFDLALVYNARGKREEAAEQLLEIVRRDRNWQDDGARNQLLQFFEAWGPADPASVAARRKLSALLFS